ncbi:MAG: hypothetical protein AAB784_00850 [Patescibacteria group bacterium]
MSRLQFFAVILTVIFVIERILSMLISWPIFIFPIFIILFLLTSKNDTDELSYVVGATLFFDFFSGFTFGLLTIATFAVSLIIHFLKNRLNINRQSVVSLLIFSLIFIFIYFAILSIALNSRLIINQFLTILIETIIMLLVFIIAFSRLVKNN